MHEPGRLQIQLLLAFLSAIEAARAEQPAISAATPVPAASVERLSEEASRAVAAVYDYDRTIPLEARIVEKVKKDGLFREKVVL